MEWKIGEIKQVNGEWYQCIIGHCNQCSFDKVGTCKFIGDPYCAYRNDKKLACFKKIEKVGEPTVIRGKLHQKFNNFVFRDSRICQYCAFHHKLCDVKCEPYEFYLEIKQNKEEMEEKNNAKHSNSEKIGKNLKPFDLQKAREGKPVCTRDGRKARIICFDLQSIENTSIVAAVQVTDKQEVIANYYENGRQFINGISELDLMMLPEKKEGWVNIYYEHDAPSHREASWVYDKEEEAIKVGKEHGSCYIATVRIEWGE